MIARFVAAVLLFALSSATRAETLHATFSPVDGRVTQLSASEDFLKSDTNQAGLWQLEGGQTSLLPSDAKSFESRTVGRNGWRLSWKDFGLTNAPALKVTVDVRCEGETSRWNLMVENPGALEWQRIRFPRISGIVERSNECLAVPQWMGQLAKNPRGLFTNSPRLEWDYPGTLSAQCLALYQDGGPGLLFSCDDTAAYRKSFALFTNAAGGLNFEMINLPERGTANAQRYKIPYTVKIEAFRGDWFTAAEQYRSWGTNQPWARQSRLHKNLTPPWLLNTGMWEWNRGRSPNVLVPAAALEEELGSPVSVFWHWWHGCAYDTGFPEYLPPREGTGSFISALAQAHNAGIHAIVYMNQRLWGMTTASWKTENAAAFAVKDERGAIRPEVYNAFTKLPCASMCLGTEFWRNKYAGLATTAIRNLDVDGIYMDQACSSLSCFDPFHGHPIGGGRYWMAGFQKLSADIRRRAGRDITLAGEGCGEAWLPYLDAMLALQVSRERYAAHDAWQPIPFFQAVYHPYAVLYGNYSSLTMPPYDDLWPEEFAPKEPLKLLDQKYSSQFRLEQARALVWGQQPTIANFMPSHLQERREETDFMLRLARLRMQGLKYFLRGTMLRPPDLAAPIETIDMSRLSIYAGQRDALKSFRAEYPTALAAAWRAPDGDLAVAIVNLKDAPQSLVLRLDGKEYGLPKHGKIFQSNEKGRIILGEFNTKVQIDVPIAAYDACLIEFSRR